MKRPVPSHMKMHKVRRAIFWKPELPAEGRIIFTLFKILVNSNHYPLEFENYQMNGCTQKWNVSSKQALVLSPDRNENTSVKLNNTHHGNNSTWRFSSTFFANFKPLDASAGLPDRNKNVSDRSSFRSFLKLYTNSQVFIRVKWIFGKCLSRMFLNIVTNLTWDNSILCPPW